MNVEFQSILFINSSICNTSEPNFFGDLNLDQIVETVISKKHQYNLNLFFYTPLQSHKEVIYRQEIMKDLQNDKLYNCVDEFPNGMNLMKEQTEQLKYLTYPLQKEYAFLLAADYYCITVKIFKNNLSDVNFHSEGFIKLYEFLSQYIKSNDFVFLHKEVELLKKSLADIQYCVRIKNNHIQVSNYLGEEDYSREIESFFYKFRQGNVKDYTYKYSHPCRMNHVEAKILELVAELNSETFTHLSQFFQQNQSFVNASISRFDREIQFYITWLDYIESFKKAGLSYCYPEITSNKSDVFCKNCYDLALTKKLLEEHKSVICNHFDLKNKERIIVVTGPNQGGKTTFARMFGQVHYLAALGCLIPGNSARLFLPDQIFTHFERIENSNSLNGKLKDDLIRANTILQTATQNSLLIFNEIFSSTTLKDAIFLSKKIMDQVSSLDLIAVWVTFVDELASYNEKTVSMTSIVDDNASRTFQIIRKSADGLAYAASIAKRHRLTYEQIKERIQF